MAFAMAARIILMMAILVVSGVVAFPAMFSESLAAHQLTENAAKEGEKPCPFAELRKRQLGGPVNQVKIPFDPVAQYVSNTGDHAFVAPTSSDLRGNCPGLNVLANHGYLPHSGYASLQQYIDAVYNVFGMSPDLGGFLSAFGTISAGDPTNLPPSWSMGGRPSDTQVGLNLIGTALIQRGNGIDNSHNVYEGDASVARGDYWQFNRDSSSLQLRFFKELYNRKTSDPKFSYDTPTLMAHCSARNVESTNENPQFFTGNFAGFVAAKAAYFFTSRLMANFSAENNVDGNLSPATLKSFYAITGPDNNLKWTRGYERIPDNWYRRPLALGYGQAGVFTDLATMIKQYPNTGRIGGNTGTVNSFAGVDTSDLTGGVYDSAALTDPKKLNCFALQLAQISSADFLSSKGLLGSVLGTVNDKILTPLISSKLAELACPALPGIKNVLFNQFPGYGAPNQP